MHIALGYRWFPTAAGYAFERAFRALGHQVSYVGMPGNGRPGYDSSIALAGVLDWLPERPDLYLWIDPAGPYFPPGIDRLPIPTACYLIDVHLGHWRRAAARFFDTVFIAQRDYLPAFRQVNPNSHWLPLAAASDVHRDHNLPRIYDVGFVGNIALAHRGTARARRLALITSRFTSNDVRAHYPPEEVGRVYSQSKIVFNTSIAGDVTMRVFEGTASGAMVLTDSVENGLGDLFAVGSEIDVYRDDAELLDKIAYFLRHDAEREQIAAAGKARTLRDHTYERRAETILAAASGSGCRAPLRDAPAGAVRAARREVLTHLHMLDALLDDSRAAGDPPWQRLRVIAPCLARRLLR